MRPRIPAVDHAPDRVSTDAVLAREPTGQPWSPVSSRRGADLSNLPRRELRVGDPSLDRLIDRVVLVGTEEEVSRVAASSEVAVVADADPLPLSHRWRSSLVSDRPRDAMNGSYLSLSVDATDEYVSVSGVAGSSRPRPALVSLPPLDPRPEPLMQRTNPSLPPSSLGETNALPRAEPPRLWPVWPRVQLPLTARLAPEVDSRHRSSFREDRSPPRPFSRRGATYRSYSSTTEAAS